MSAELDLVFEKEHFNKTIPFEDASEFEEKGRHRVEVTIKASIAAFDEAYDNAVKKKTVQ